MFQNRNSNSDIMKPNYFYTKYKVELHSLSMYDPFFWKQKLYLHQSWYIFWNVNMNVNVTVLLSFQTLNRIEIPSFLNLD